MTHFAPKMSNVTIVDITILQQLLTESITTALYTYGQQLERIGQNMTSLAGSLQAVLQQPDSTSTNAEKLIIYAQLTELSSNNDIIGLELAFLKGKLQGNTESSDQLGEPAGAQQQLAAGLQTAFQLLESVAGIQSTSQSVRMDKDDDILTIEELSTSNDQ